MDNHKKPTAEELEAANQKILADLEKAETEDAPDTTTTEDEEETTDTATTATTEDTATSDSEDEEEETDTDDTDTDDTKVEDKSQDEDTKKRYAESTKEAQKLASDNKIMADALSEANTITDATEDELKGEYPEWEDMSTTERKLAKEVLINKKRFNAINAAAEKRKSVEKWNEKVDEYIDKPETLVHNPLLEGKQEDFKLFAKSKDYRDQNMNLIVGAFLHKVSTERKQHKGKMFETGASRSTDNPKPKDDRLTPEQAADLMHRDYAKYREMLKAGKIADQ